MALVKSFARFFAVAAVLCAAVAGLPRLLVGPPGDPATATSAVAADANHDASQPAVMPQAPPPGPVARTTAPQATPPLPPKVVDLEDLGLVPRKYEDRLIEVQNLVCYYADVGDYRCLPSSLEGPPVVIFPKEITDETERVVIEENCDTIRSAIRSEQCRVSLVFTFDAADVDVDLISGDVERHVISPKSAKAIPMHAAHRRRH